MRGEIGEKYNKFNGKIENMNNDIFQEIFHDVNKVNLIKNLNINLNGSYNFITDKNFKLEILNFFSEGSYINFINKRNNKSILKSKFNGEMSWKKKDNLLNFKNVFIAPQRPMYRQSLCR